MAVGAQNAQARGGFAVGAGREGHVRQRGAKRRRAHAIPVVHAQNQTQSWDKGRLRIRCHGKRDADADTGAGADADADAADKRGRQRS